MLAELIVQTHPVKPDLWLWELRIDRKAYRSGVEATESEAMDAAERAYCVWKQRAGLVP